MKSAMSALIRFLPFICILSCFMLLGLTTRSYALCDSLPNPYVNYSGTWTVQGNGCYATADDASAACEDHELSGIPCAYKAAGGFGLNTAFYITYAPSAQKTFGIYWIDPDGIGDCSSERAAAESECGGPDLYVIDEATCEWHCDDSQDCPDSDSDGAADVCDPCPDNSDISELSEQIYRLNGDPMSEKCGESTMSCDGSINFEGNTGTICQAAEVETTECRAVRGAGAVCKADKDTDGDGTYDTDDEDDDGDGIPDSEDTDDDGDGIPDGEDPDHEDYRDYDNDGIPDSIDPDDDNDEIPDGQDPCPQNSDPNCEDSDGDGIPDSEDPDDDGDGTPDSEDEDDDGDGVPDEQDMPVDWGDYGKEPDDLPELDFGKVEETPENPNSPRSKVKSGLNNLFPVFSGASCSSIISLPVPSAGGLEWHEYPLNLCPYESILSSVGTVLVFLTALYELYKFS